MTTLLMVGLVIVTVAIANAQTLPTLTVKGETFTNVTVTNVTAAHATIYFDGGGKRVLISDLPTEIQRQLNFDAAAAQAELSKESAAAAQKKRDELERWRAAHCRMIGNEIVEARFLTSMTGIVTSVHVDGVMISVPQFTLVKIPGHIVPADRSIDSKTRSGGISQTQGFEVPDRYETRPTRRKTIFVKCSASDFAPGEVAIFWTRRDGAFTNASQRFEQYLASTPYVPKP